MRKVLLIITICIAVSVIYFFRWNIAPLQVKELEQQNLTSYTFPLDLVSTHNKLVSGFSIENQIKNQGVFSFESLSRPEYAKSIILSLETHENPLFGKEVFKDTANKLDIYLHSFGEPITSHSYFVLGQPLEYRASFHIHLIPKQDGNTTVSIKTINPSVIKGIGGIGPHGFYSNDVPVLPTSIEEYELLRFIGFLLDEKKMPPVLYPN